MFYYQVKIPNHPDIYIVSVYKKDPDSAIFQVENALKSGSFLYSAQDGEMVEEARACRLQTDVRRRMKA